MSDQPQTYPDTLDGLRQLLLDADVGFSLHKSHHWDAVLRDVLGPWLDAHDAATRQGAFDELELVRYEHRATYPETLSADSAMTTRVLNDEEDAAARVKFINRRLAGWGLPEVAYVESRALYARPWPAHGSSL